MKPLVVLIVVFVICLVITSLLNHELNYAFSGRIAMSAMLLFTSVAHFKFRDGMIRMLPDFVPAKDKIILGTGLIEIAGAIGLLINNTAKLSGILLIIFFILILPANIYGSIKRVNLEKNNYDGMGLSYLWFRIPLQFFFIGWIYWFVLR